MSVTSQHHRPFEPTTTATASSAVLNDTHHQASSTELEGFYTTYYHLPLPPDNDVLLPFAARDITATHYALPAAPSPEALGDLDIRDVTAQHLRDTTNGLADFYDLPNRRRIYGTKDGPVLQ
jgi:hypothetical protein